MPGIDKNDERIATPVCRTAGNRSLIVSMQPGSKNLSLDTGRDDQGKGIFMPRPQIQFLLSQALIFKITGQIPAIRVFRI